MMSTALTVDTSGGAPTLSLNDNETATYDAAALDPTAGLWCSITPRQDPDQTPDLEITQFNAGGSSIEDDNGVNADFSGAIDYPTGLSVNSPLVVTSVSASGSGNLVQSGQTLQLTLTMSEAIQVDFVDTGSLTLTLSDGATATYDDQLSIPSDGTLVFDYTVGATDIAADLAISEVNPAGGVTIQDAGGFNADFSKALNVPTGVEINFAIGSITPAQIDQLAQRVSPTSL